LYGLSAFERIAMVITSFEFLSASGCLLCDELEGNSPLSVRIGLWAYPKTNVLLDSDLFVLISDISPLVRGHCLLIPKEHYSSLATLPEAHIEKLKHFTKECIGLVSEQFCAPFLFEHGSGVFEPRSGACIHHAHMHFFPLTAPVDQWMTEFGEVQDLGRVGQYELCERLRLGDYLAYQDQRGNSYLVAHLKKRPPCQFIRRRIAEHFNLAEWDWESAFIRKLPPIASKPGTHSSMGERLNWSGASSHKHESGSSKT
jgi:diadenosine tetraphosphate (Ap4A) HIT family hydrolase